MVFNSVEYIVFFSAFFILYWFVFGRNLQAQNIFLLAGSYLFYAWWDWSSLLLLAGSSIVIFFLGVYIDKTENEQRRRLLVYVGLLLGLGCLLFFKYYNFFIESLTDALSVFSIKLHLQTLHLILPLGISFYTFRSISYLLDVDSGKIKPSTDPVAFCTYIAFFPSLLAGPIDRARTFIPQLEKKRQFEYSHAAEGMRQILWGLFKKVVIADNCATVTDTIFGQHAGTGSSFVLGAFLYIIQVYADFSGYSDMAIGFARLLGFNIVKNFNFPFFAQNIAEFWQRWHISLTTWMTEYVYTPLSFVFRKLRKTGIILAIIINFILVGLWHGANWTFVLFGLLQGCYFIPMILRGTLNTKNNVIIPKFLPGGREFINMAGTFTLMMLTSLLFRASNLKEAFGYYKSILSSSLFSAPRFMGLMNTLLVMALIIFFMSVEWLGRNKDFAISKLDTNFNRPLRWIIYLLLIFMMGMYSETKEMPFIYSKF